MCPEGPYLGLSELFQEEMLHARGGAKRGGRQEGQSDDLSRGVIGGTRIQRSLVRPEQRDQGGTRRHEASEGMTSCSLQIHFKRSEHSLKYYKNAYSKLHF